MKVIIQDMAHDSIDSLFDYLANYSLKNAIETIDRIYEYIYHLEDSPYIGRYVPKIPDKHFRELLYRKNRSAYRILYFISEETDTIYIVYVYNCKQDFNRILKIHNYFNNFFKF